LTALGPPATQQGSDEQARYRRLGSAGGTKLSDAQTAANKVENGNLDAAAALISDLPAGASLASALLSNTRTLASTDLAITVLETKTCRQLAGVSI
jgi:hypothetical protein